jgi:hypothetical protein
MTSFLSGAGAGRLLWDRVAASAPPETRKTAHHARCSTNAPVQHRNLNVNTTAIGKSPLNWILTSPTSLFGTRLITTALGSHGDVQLRFEPAGVVCLMLIDLNRALREPTFSSSASSF